jgi:hypothetical protein
MSVANLVNAELRPLRNQAGLESLPLLDKYVAESEMRYCQSNIYVKPNGNRLIFEQAK